MGVVTGRSNPYAGLNNPAAPVGPVVPLGDMYEGEIGDGTQLSGVTGEAGGGVPPVPRPLRGGPLLLLACSAGGLQGFRGAGSAGVQGSGSNTRDPLPARLARSACIPEERERSPPAPTAPLPLHSAPAASHLVAPPRLAAPQVLASPWPA